MAKIKSHQSRLSTNGDHTVWVHAPPLVCLSPPHITPKLELSTERIPSSLSPFCIWWSFASVLHLTELSLPFSDLTWAQWVCPCLALRPLKLVMRAGLGALLTWFITCLHCSPRLQTSSLGIKTWLWLIRLIHPSMELNQTFSKELRDLFCRPPVYKIPHLYFTAAWLTWVELPFFWPFEPVSLSVFFYFVACHRHSTV